MQYYYFNRDISWLSFNERVLEEAEKSTLPIMERFNFLSIYSSNLDEFFRVRIPTLIARQKVGEETIDDHGTFSQVQEIIQGHQIRFGKLIKEQLVPILKHNHKIELIYNRPIPSTLRAALRNYFINKVASFTRIIDLTEKKDFFPENNRLYVLVKTREFEGSIKTFVVNIPSEHLPRFFLHHHRNRDYIIFLDDIVKLSLPILFKDHEILSCNNIKITRSAEYEIEDEFEGDIAVKIEKELEKRDRGLATRFLYEGPLDKESLRELQKKFGLRKASLVNGGPYHNLKDLNRLPLTGKEFFNKPWPTLDLSIGKSIFESISTRAFFIHTPYHSFDPLIRFFNEASIDPSVTSIYTTIYRIAKNSLIANALINAAKHGKKVYVFVELKARFDESNNLKWARKMEEAGVKTMFSLPRLKVHSKAALVKRKQNHSTELYGVLGTGNFHENTAALYTDHYLFTSDHELLSEVELLFKYLRARKKGLSLDEINFRKLLVGQFNLQDSLVRLIDVEIENATARLPASITIKVNAIEDAVLINKLYMASEAGVKVRLLVRGICCLVPGVKGMSENITVTRIVDRYLEHGRVFIFENNGSPTVILGSSDWMTRNMYRRIEVCFTISDENLKEEIIHLTNVQLADNTQAVRIDSDGTNLKVVRTDSRVCRAQEAISEMVKLENLKINKLKD
jgi:polyphosphate kinase